MNKFFLPLLFFILSISSISKSQVHPTFDMTLRNLTTVPNVVTGADSIIRFDIYLLWTNSTAPGVNQFEYGAAQYNLTYNPALGNASNLTVTKIAIPGAGNLVPGNQPPTFQIAPDPGVDGRPLLQASSNLADPTRNQVILDTGNGTRCVRMQIRTTTHVWPFVTPDFKFQLTPPNNTFLAYFLPPVDPKDPDNQLLEPLMDTVINHYSVLSNPQLGSQAPTPNFYTTTRVITQGGSVNFLDSSFNATSWSWTFPGGTPSSSTAQNPTGIVYNTPGSYSVTLVATNSHGSNSITKNNYITVNPPPCPIVWQNKITVSDAGNIRDTLTFGTSLAATNGIDACLGESSLPPVPPTGAFDARFIVPAVPVDASKKDYRYDLLSDRDWIINFQPSSSGYPISFSWNSASFPAQGLFYLVDQLGGSFVNVNMKTQSSYVLSNTGITSLKIQYKYLVTMPVPVKATWNLLSIPVMALNMRTTIIFPTAVSNTYGFNGTSYIVADTFKNGKGYWVKFGSDTTYNIEGVLINPKNIPVVSGWNMIGPFDENIPVSAIVSSPAGIVNSSYYSYNNGYITADTLKAGKGYWIRTTGAGTLSKNTTDWQMYSSFSDSLDNWIRVEIRDRDNNVMKLYLASSNQITGNYDLPPVPPQGIFDVRFTSDRSVETRGAAHTIKLNSTTKPLTITAYNLNGENLKIKDATGGSLFNEVLEEGQSIEMGLELDNLVLFEDGVIPSDYSLEQNYPNPFNPVTKIKYQIPDDGNVSIILYDVVGKEIKTIVNKYLSAGKYEVEVNANGLSSGIYFYRMKSDKFSQIKKMVVLK